MGLWTCSGSSMPGVWNAQFPLLSPQLRTKSGRSRHSTELWAWEFGPWWKRTTVAHPPISMLCIKTTRFLWKEYNTGIQTALQFLTHCGHSGCYGTCASQCNIIMWSCCCFLDFLTPERCGVAIMMVTSKVMWVHEWRPAYPWVPPVFLYPSNRLLRSLLLLWLPSPSSTPINNSRMQHTRELVRLIALTFLIISICTYLHMTVVRGHVRVCKMCFSTWGSELENDLESKFKETVRQIQLHRLKCVFYLKTQDAKLAWNKDVTGPRLQDTRALGLPCIILKSLVWLFEAVILPMTFYFGREVTIWPWTSITGGHLYAGSILAL